VDYDGDGRLDILTGSISGKVYLFRRKPNGTFAEGEVVQQRATGMLGLGRSSMSMGGPSAVAMADWYDSGKLDLFVGNGEGHVYLFRNEGTRQKAVYQRGARLTAGGKPVIADGGNAGPCIADWDGDGQLDLVLGSSSGRIVFFRNIGSKTDPQLAAGITLVEAAPSRSDREALRNPKRSGSDTRVCAADWNGDKLPDLVVGDFWPMSLRAHGWVWVYLRKPGEAAQAKTE
jgi:hypothetical protein